MGYEVKVTDLYAMNFNPVTSKDDFIFIQHADFISLVNE
jgi:putative NADPH-quinone reductase